jgi:hypothetical protein
MKGISSEQGVAMLVAIMALLLMAAIGSVLILTSTSETIIAAHFRDSVEARYAAGATIERGMDDLGGIADWSVVISGAVHSSWVDGPASGSRTLAAGSTIDLTQIVNLASCQKPTPCSTADMDAVTADRPWGTSNPRWVLFAYGAVRDLLPGSATIDSPYYVVLLAGAAVAPAGWNAVALRAEAFGPRNSHAVVEAAAGRAAGTAPARFLSWRELR